MLSIESKLLENERKNLKFDIEEVTNLLDGGREATARRRQIINAIQSQPILCETENIFYMTREERLVNGVKRAIALNQFMKNNEELFSESYASEYANSISRAIAKDISLPIHAGVFVPTILNLGTEEQIAKWVEPSKNLNIIGTYAQTELGHGSFLRGLEMEAVYEPSTDHFRINCPDITAMKWWPGDMGVCANHVVVMAQLIVNGNRHGMHAFIVQIRDMNNHLPLPGVEVGVIGDKLGFEAVDNGFLYLKNVKVPRENMLARYTKLARDGSYSISGNPMVIYGSMLLTRVNLLVPEGIVPLQMACTIATRYSLVRRQGLIHDNQPEVPVMEYQTQQGKVLPQIAKAYAFHLAVRYVRSLHNDMKTQIENGDFSMLPEVHALAAGMKSHITESSLDGSEICRRACGGHGYMQASGFPFILVAQMGSVIYEGENTVMHLQCARTVFKY